MAAGTPRCIEFGRGSVHHRRRWTSPLLRYASRGADLDTTLGGPLFLAPDAGGFHPERLLPVALVYRLQYVTVT
ncbi:MAG: hypothetical protein GXP36_11455 [Actinobacteria bacterium]|nr:hypothetical protein [Actinomycetota bacterium]